MLPLLLEEDSLEDLALLAAFELLELFELFVLQDMVFLLNYYFSLTMPDFPPALFDLRTGRSGGNTTFC